MPGMVCSNSASEGPVPGALGGNSAVAARSTSSIALVRDGGDHTSRHHTWADPLSGGVAPGVGEPSFREAFLPQDAAIAESAGSTVGTRLVAGPREREINAQGMA